MLLKLIVDGRVKSNLQVAEAVSYLKKLPAGTTVILFGTIYY